MCVCVCAHTRAHTCQMFLETGGTLLVVIRILIVSTFFSTIGNKLHLENKCIKTVLNFRRFLTLYSFCFFACLLIFFQNIEGVVSVITVVSYV